MVFWNYQYRNVQGIGLVFVGNMPFTIDFNIAYPDFTLEE